MLNKLREEAGQGLAEYGWLIFLIAIFLVVLLGVFGEQVYALYQYIIDYLTAHAFL